MLKFCSPLVALVLLSGTYASAQPATPREDAYYRLVTVPTPEGVVLEVGGLATLPGGALAASTRRGEVWIVENAGLGGSRRPHFRLFARGLHEPLGLAYHEGALYAAQRGELTRLVDGDGDGRADRFETVYRWPLEGNYHEYAYGPLFRADGSMLVTLNLAWVGHGASLSKWHGWMLSIDPDGVMTPVAAGMRSPAGLGLTPEGDVFYAENQGDWIGSGYITHVEPGDFVGNPAGLRWSGEPGSPVTLRPEDIPDTGESMFEVAKRVPGLKPPSVWFPHTLMGISTSGILADTTGGAFGPFAGQLFVGDQGHSKIMRVALEKVDGVYQGAVFPFREGFASGVLRLAWGQGGGLFVGMTSRGWDATGKAPYGLQRLEWTGQTPFEPQTIAARPDGFEITFTRPVDRKAAAKAAAYQVRRFAYAYHHHYGSPPIHTAAVPVRRVVVSDDGLRARLVVEAMQEGYIHEIKMGGVRDVDGEALLHDVAYYTLNRRPGGAKAAQQAPSAEVPQVAPPRPAPAAQGGAEVTFEIGTLPGLRFDVEALEVRAGARVEIRFRNNDDMLHNLVVTAPGAADEVAAAAVALGLEGHARGYVPPDDRVLFHTALLEPGQADAIIFTAPETPGLYPFVCTFPGHAATMRGILRVVP